MFRPYAGVSTAILVFTKTGVGGTDYVWFYDVQADGWSLDDKRQPLLPEEQAGADACAADRGGARQEQSARRADALGGARRRGTRAAAHRAELLRAESGDRGRRSYDLSLSRYKETMQEVAQHGSPAAIIAELKGLESEDARGVEIA